MSRAPTHRALLGDWGQSISRGPGPNPYAGVTTPSIGLSTYRNPQGALTSGQFNNNHYHYVVLLEQVNTLIDHKVGAPFPCPPGMKAPKISEPRKYSGSPSHDEFIDWLGEFLNWLKCHYICGPDNDEVCTTFLGLYVTGTVADWYLTEIDNPARHYDPALRFQDVICLMHRRFVRTATANGAIVKYHAVRYAASDGVEGLFYKLDRAAEHMIERPSDYKFKYRLFNCLPKWLHDKLKDRNMLPEYSSLEDLRENVRQLEENSLRQYEGVGDLSRGPVPQPSLNPWSSAAAPRATTAP